MGFLEQLGKGFIRSAVNQVGRDTGKVVSNKIYGDAHATPIRGVSSNNGIFFDEILQKELTEAEFTNRLNEEGYKIQYFTMNPIAKSLLWSFGVIITVILYACAGKYYALICPILLVACAILKALSTRKGMEVYQYKDMAAYKADRRFREGKRFVGYSREKIGYTISPTKRYKVCGVIIAILYVVLSIAMLYTAVYIFNHGEGYETWIPLVYASAYVCIFFLILHAVFKMIK